MRPWWTAPSTCSAPSTTSTDGCAWSTWPPAAASPHRPRSASSAASSTAGLLERRDDATYVVGRRLWDLGLLAPVQTGLREVAAPFLQDLQAVTRATVHLAERDGDRALYLDRLSGVASVPVVSRVGSRLPLHATGVGKVLLAHAPPDVQARVLAEPEQDHRLHRHLAPACSPSSWTASGAKASPPPRRR